MTSSALPFPKPRIATKQAHHASTLQGPPRARTFLEIFALQLGFIGKAGRGSKKHVRSSTWRKKLHLCQKWIWRREAVRVAHENR